MKLHLKLLAIAVNITQAAFCRLDTVLLTFGFLVMQYQQMADEDDYITSASIISCLEKCWMAADHGMEHSALTILLKCRNNSLNTKEGLLFLGRIIERAFLNLW